MNHQNTKYELSLISSIESISQLEEFLELMLEEWDVSSDCYGNIMTSLNEAVVNAIVHGNNSDPNKNVSLTVDVIADKGFVFKVKDEGSGFDYENIENPTSEENIEKFDGRGVFIMRNMSDNCIFSNKGSEVELHFNF